MREVLKMGDSRAAILYSASPQNWLFLVMTAARLVRFIFRMFVFLQVMGSVAVAVGFLLHYIMPQLRKQLPWLCLARPVLRHNHQVYFEPHHPPSVMWFEKVSTS